MTTPTRTRRSRVRNLDTTSTTELPKAPKGALTSARDFYSHNNLKNFHNRESEKARKALFQELSTLKDNKQPFHFVHPTTVDGKPVTLDIDLVEGSSTLVDLKLLKKLVKEEEFWEIISATKTRVKEVAGETVANRVFSSTPNGKFSATVKVAK